MTTLDERRTLMIEAAMRHGCFRLLEPEDAETWAKEWRALLAATLPSRRRRAPEPSLVVPGTWIRFRPQASSSGLGALFVVVAVVPPGVPLDALLSAAQLSILDRHTTTVAIPRLTRVVLGVPGNRRSISSLRTVLAGSLAARAHIVPEAEAALLRDGRLPQPLPPGSVASWRWHSAFGEASCSGLILGYVPAGTAIQSALPGLHAQFTLNDISDQDRYVVRLDGTRRCHLKSPAAHLVERGGVEGTGPTSESMCSLVSCGSCSSSCPLLPAPQPSLSRSPFPAPLPGWLPGMGPDSVDAQLHRA